MDHHIDNDRDGEDKKPEKNIDRNLEDMEHLDNIRNTIILTPVVEELAVEWALIILEDIPESPDIHIEWAIEIDIDIREADTIREWIGILLDQRGEIRIASGEECECILSRDIVHLHSWEWRRHTREELNRPDLRVIIAILEIDTDRYTIVDTRDESVGREYDEEEDMNKKYQETDNQEWWRREENIAEDIADSIADELHEIVFLDTMSWLYTKMRKSELKFDKREEKC